VFVRICSNRNDLALYAYRFRGLVRESSSTAVKSGGAIETHMVHHRAKELSKTALQR
jgi:hypothetical protein